MNLNKTQYFARTENFWESVIYTPKVRPGFASWVAVWPVAGKENEHMLSFIEIKQGERKTYRPIPLEFWESFGVPIKYQSQMCDGDRNLIYETVIMHSKDDGKTWNETGRNSDVPDQLEAVFCYCSLPNGDILRGRGTQFIAFYPDEKPRLIIQKSCDGGNTWTDFTVVEEGFYTTPYRLKRLKDSMLVLLSSFSRPFGPGNLKKTRSLKEPYLRVDYYQVIYVSTDDGRTWKGPMPILHGVTSCEPDFIELPSGDLLVVNSTVTGVEPVRQYLYRTAAGFVPGPVYDIRSGEVPETFVMTEEGLLVGANRRGLYSCSNDEGETWHIISGTAKCGYQPMVTKACNGSIICIWHHGMDNFYGEIDQFIGMHEFNIDAGLPGKTVIILDRDMNEQKTKYMNSYTFVLKSGENPLPDKKTTVFLEERYKKEKQEFRLITDENGRASIRFDRFDEQRNIHLWYSVSASFEPGEGESELAPCSSGSYFAYSLTPEKGKRNTYRAYVANECLYVENDILTRYPEIVHLVDTLKDSKSFDIVEAVSFSGIEKTKVEEILGFLSEEYILSGCSNGSFSWIWEVKHPVREIDVFDDFV